MAILHFAILVSSINNVFHITFFALDFIDFTKKTFVVLG